MEETQTTDNAAIWSESDTAGSGGSVDCTQCHEDVLKAREPQQPR